MFVLDLFRPRPIDDGEEDDEEDEEEGVRVDEDAGMDVDEGGGEGDEGYEINEWTRRNGGAPENDTLGANLVQLAAWADMFLDDHLRMLEPFAEIWFLDPRFRSQAAAGFNQRVMEGEEEGGRAQHIICPILKRDGWWWDDPIPLD